MQIGFEQVAGWEFSDERQSRIKSSTKSFDCKPLQIFGSLMTGIVEGGFCRLQKHMLVNGVSKTTPVGAWGGKSQN